MSSNTTNWILAVVAGTLLVLIPAAASAQQAPNAGGTISAARKKADSAGKQGADKKAPARSTRRTSSRRTGRSQLRDPFQSLGGGSGRSAEPGGSRKRPSGERGLLISQIQVGGIVLGGRGKIAVVAVQGRDRAFFLREGDRVYDGILKEIRSDRVIFRQRSRDAFGRVIVRDVTKMLTSLPIGS